jgi:hypothetical protein
LRAWVFKTVGKAGFRGINRILHVFDYDIFYCEAYILTERSTSVVGLSRNTAFPHIHTYTTTTVLQALSNLGYMVSSNPYNSTTMSASAPSKSVQATETEAFERELAALTAYEDGWDRWDGPIWPVGYEQCRLRRSRLSFPFSPLLLCFATVPAHFPPRACTNMGVEATWGESSVPTTPATEEEGLRFETRKE